MDDATPTRDRARVIDDFFAGLQRWGLRIVVIAAALWVLGWVIGRFWVIGFPVSIALIVTSLVAPVAAWLRRHRVPAGLAAAGAVIGFLTVVATIIAVLAPQIAGQAPDIAESASNGLAEIRRWLVEGPLGVSEGQITNAIDAVEESLRGSADAISAGIFSTLSTATSSLINIILILMLTFFFTKDGHRFAPWASALAGHRAGEHTYEVLSRAWRTLGGFIRTQSLVSLIDAVIIGIGLLILDVPLAVPLAVLTFFAGYIPIIGAVVSGALAVLVTLVTNSPRDALIVFLLVLAVQQIEGNVLSPMLQSKSMNLQPAVVLLAVTAGGSIFGITGAFLAVPTAAIAAELFRYVNERMDDAVDDDAPPEDATASAVLDDGARKPETDRRDHPDRGSD